MGNAYNPLSEVDADVFARSWLDAWNSHDASRISAHYSDDVEYHSPFVARLTGGDALHGRAAVEEYAAAALARYPDLHFGPDITVATGAGSLALVYRSVEGRWRPSCSTTGHSSRVRIATTGPPPPASRRSEH